MPARPATPPRRGPSLVSAADWACTCGSVSRKAAASKPYRPALARTQDTAVLTDSFMMSPSDPVRGEAAGAGHPADLDEQPVAAVRRPPQRCGDVRQPHAIRIRELRIVDGRPSAREQTLRIGALASLIVIPSSQSVEDSEPARCGSHAPSGVPGTTAAASGRVPSAERTRSRQTPARIPRPIWLAVSAGSQRAYAARN